MLPTCRAMTDDGARNSRSSNLPRFRLGIGSRDIGIHSKASILPARRFAFALALTALLALGRPAQALELTMGTRNTLPSTSPGIDLPVQTLVDLSSPANASGWLERIEFNWSGYPCPDAADLVTLRRQGDRFREISRQTFGSVQHHNELRLGNPIWVEQGDYIAVTIRGTGCGMPFLGYAWGLPQRHIATIAGGPSSFDLSEATIERERVLDLYGTGTAVSRIAAIVPVIARAPGRNESFFRTSFFLASPDLDETSWNVKFAYREKGVAGDPDSDLVRTWTLGRREWINWPDFMRALDIPPSLVGTVDIVLPADVALPPAQCRTWNEIDGTAGYRTEIPLVDPTTPHRPGARVLRSGAKGHLFPKESGRERMNIGVRTLDRGAIGYFEEAYPGGGYSLPFGVFFLPPRTLIQYDLAAFDSGAGTDHLRAVIWSGDAIVYQSIVDNVTNASTFRIAEASELRFGEWDPVCPAVDP